MKFKNSTYFLFIFLLRFFFEVKSFTERLNTAADKTVRYNSIKGSDQQLMFFRSHSVLFVLDDAFEGRKHSNKSKFNATLAQ